MEQAPPSTERTRTLRHRGFLLAVVANVLGGLAYPVQKLALEGLPPATVTFARNALALLFMWAWLRLRGGPRRPWTRRDLALLFTLGTVGYALPMYLGIAGVERSTASNGSVLVLVEPMMVLVFASLFLKEDVRSGQILGVFVGLIGALLILFEGASVGDLLAGEHLDGNLLLLAHGVLWGLFTPLVKTLSARHDPVRVIFLTTAISLLLLGPAAWTEADRWHVGPGLPTAVVCVLALAIGVSFGCAALWAAATRHISAASIAPFVFLQPLAGILAGVFFIGERLTTAGMCGALVICVGVGFVLRVGR
ncbi:MAG: DMT family transporter [Planctomycetota bacterium]